MAYNTVLKIDNASFQLGNNPIKSVKYGRNDDGTVKNGFIVGNDGIDATITVQPGWRIQTESFIDDSGYPALRIRTIKPDTE